MRTELCMLWENIGVISIVLGMAGFSFSMVFKRNKYIVDHPICKFIAFSLSSLFLVVGAISGITYNSSTEVGDYVHLTQANAAQSVKGDSLNFIFDNSEDIFPESLVYGQSLLPGTYVKKGTDIALFFRKGIATNTPMKSTPTSTQTPQSPTAKKIIDDATMAPTISPANNDDLFPFPTHREPISKRIYHFDSFITTNWVPGVITKFEVDEEITIRIEISISDDNSIIATKIVPYDNVITDDMFFDAPLVYKEKTLPPGKYAVCGTLPQSGLSGTITIWEYIYE